MTIRSTAKGHRPEPGGLSAIRLDAVLFASPHPEALAAFYQHGFGLEPPTRQGPDHLGFALSNTYLGFDRVAETATVSKGSVSIWFKVADIEASFSGLVRLGAKVKQAPTKDASPGELLALLFDPDGNMIGLICPSAKA